MSNDIGARIIGHLVREDLAARKAAFALAQMKHSSGELTSAEFADYIQDVANGQAAYDLWERIRPRP